MINSRDRFIISKKSQGCVYGRVQSVDLAMNLRYRTDYPLEFIKMGRTQSLLSLLSLPLPRYFLAAVLNCNVMLE